MLDKLSNDTSQNSSWSDKHSEREKLSAKTPNWAHSSSPLKRSEQKYSNFTNFSFKQISYKNVFS